MRACTTIFSVSLLVLASGCGEVTRPQQGVTPTPMTTDDASPVAQPVGSASALREVQGGQQTLAVGDRVQAHYRTTSVRLADGTEFGRGRAKLEIRYDTEHPHATLTLRAQSQSDSLIVALRLDVEEVAGARLDQHIVGPALLKRTRGAELVPVRAPSQIILERRQESGKRASFQGRLLDDRGALSAEFQTELTISCLVPPEMLGVVPNGHAESPGVTLLVRDDELRSPFCAKFSGLL